MSRRRVRRLGRAGAGASGPESPRRPAVRARRPGPKPRRSRPGPRFARRRPLRSRGFASMLSVRTRPKRPRSPKRARSPKRPLTPRRLAARAAALAALAAAAAFAVHVALRAAARLPVFRVAAVEATGLFYVAEDELRALAGLDADASIWDSKEEWRRRLLSHPMIESVEIARRLPSTLLVAIEEAKPVALVASPLVMAVDRHGALLPIDPADPVLDLPLVSVLRPGPAGGEGLELVAREVEHVAQAAPEVFAVISEAHLEDGLVTFYVGDSGLRIRYPPPISERRLREGIVAMNDALERFPERPLAEVDLRFEDQVVVRAAAAREPGTVASTGQRRVRAPDGGAAPGASS